MKPNPIPNEELAELMEQVPLIEDWCKAIRARAYAELMNSNKLPGFKLVIGRKGSRKWDDDKEAEKIMKSMKLKVDEMYTKKVLTAPQAEKLLKQSPKRWARLSELIVQSEGKPGVVPESDKHEEFIPTPVSEDFDDLTDA